MNCPRLSRTSCIQHVIFRLYRVENERLAQTNDGLPVPGFLSSSVPRKDKNFRNSY